jgi:hypothetical protein
MRFLPFAVIFIALIILSSCSSDKAADARRDVRLDWRNYFNAYLDMHGKESQLGTDSTKIVFENNSDYTVDSAIVIFENQGLLVHHFDTLTIPGILSKSKKSISTPAHKLGLVHKAQIYEIYSKALEFHYVANLPEEKKTGDCYYTRVK